MSTRVAICLFEDYITEFNTSDLMGGQPLTNISLLQIDTDVTVYLKKSTESTPQWTDILRNFSDIKISDTATASSGAILFYKKNNRVIGCCFGTTVANINKENIVRDFGLAVAFNRISRTNYKGIETFTLTENPITNNRTTARPSTQNSFNLDTYLETITELSGKYYSATRNVLVKGKEFFSVPAPLTLNDIKELCENLINEYDKTIKDSNYKKLTAITKVKTKRLIDYLNDELCKSLNNRSNSVYLVDYQQYEGLDTYSLTPKGDRLVELEIDDIYDNLQKEQKFSTAYLKNRKIGVYDKNNQQIDEWPLYKCIFVEYSLNVGGHILYKGNWYEIQKRYLNDLKQFIKNHEIPASNVALPPWDGNMKEEDYNLMAAKKFGGQCWDKVLYNHPDYSYGIEFCDLLLPNYVMHVKKLSSSALNSHLLMQTYVSAQLLKVDPGIKKWITERSTKTFKKNIFLKSNKFKAPPVKYLFVLMAKNKSKSIVDVLPFFSLVTFNMIIRRITELDFTVEICIV